MKVILTGATGLVGGGVLDSLVRHPKVDSVVILSRREVESPSARDRKVTTIIHKDFNTYGPDVLDKIGDADACVWALGSPTGGLDVHLGYPRAFTEAFLKHLKSRPTTSKPFHYVSCSGALTVRDQNAKPWFLSVGRKARGGLETELSEIQSANPTLWRTYILRPAYVVKESGSSIVAYLPAFLAAYFIDYRVLGAAFAALAVDGGEKQTFENSDLLLLGKTGK